MDDKVIDLTPHLRCKKIPVMSAYGERAVCPECHAYDMWKVLIKKDGKKYNIAAIVCASDECDGETVVEIGRGKIEVEDG